LKDGLFNIQASDWGNVVWHMSQYNGTGETAPEAQEMHKFIRKQFVRHTETISQKLSILYGGSVKPENAKDFL
jgi:triosephosphate isomerase